MPAARGTAIMQAISAFIRVAATFGVRARKAASGVSR